jgi:hypothetical protein
VKLLVIYGSAPDVQSAWPWTASTTDAAVRHLGSLDLAEQIEQADFVALSVACGMLPKAWARVEALLKARDVPMIAFERLDPNLMRSIRLGGTCVATLTDEGRVELQCRAQKSAFQRISMAVAENGGYRRESPPVGGAGEGSEGSEGDRVTRFVFQAK